MTKHIGDSKEFRIKLGENIRKARLKLGLTQAQLAEMLGRSDNVITNWEKGTNRPDADMIEKLCNILGVSPNELMSWEEPDTKPSTLASTIAAHFEGEEFTEEELKEIYNYIEYIKSKKK